MEKLTIEKRVELDYFDETVNIEPNTGVWLQEIDSLMQHLQNLKSNGATHIEVYFGTDDWGQEKFDDAEIEGIYFEEESDEEFKLRKEEEELEKGFKEQMKIKKLKEDYLKLKQIFEPNEK
jgi:hypothetical protein